MQLQINRFRKEHLISILTLFSKESCPLDVFLGGYFRKEKAIGSKDRKFISDTVYGITRWLGLIDHFLERPISWQARVEKFLSLQPEKYANDPRLPPYIRVSFPKNFYNFLVESLGEEKAMRFALASNFVAPTCVRANSLKISRDDLLKQWLGTYDVSPSTNSPNGIIFNRKINFFTLEEFKEGLFEVQDEGSQLVAELVRCKPGQHILDYCSGAGGKSLAIAPSLGGKGQLYLHDIRSFALKEAQKRISRAGIYNAKIVEHTDPKKSSLRHKMDWILVDAPCSGTGTLRRNPDMKWKFELGSISRLVSLQRTIFREAFDFLKPEGYIVYATCSVLPQENEEQLAYFLKEFPVKLVEAPFSSFPELGKMDGFFGVILQKVLPCTDRDSKIDTTS